MKTLHDLLESRGVSVWFSEKDVALGTSLLREIDKGWVKSRVGIVLVTPALLRRLPAAGVADKELSALQALISPEAISGTGAPWRRRVAFVGTASIDPIIVRSGSAIFIDINMHHLSRQRFDTKIAEGGKLPAAWPFYSMQSRSWFRPKAWPISRARPRRATLLPARFSIANL